MDIAASQYKFDRLMTMDTNSDSFIHLVRRLFALGYAAPVQLRGGDVPLLEDMMSTISAVLKKKEFNRARTTAAVAVAYALSRASTRFSDMGELYIEFILKMLEMGVDLVNNLIGDIVKCYPLFVHFLFNGITMIRRNEELTVRCEMLLQQCCAILTRAVGKCHVVFDLRNGLSGIVSGFEYDLTMKTKNFMLSTLSVTMRSYKCAVRIVEDAGIRDVVPAFMVMTLRKEDMGLVCDGPIRGYAYQETIPEIDTHELMSAMTFESDVPVVETEYRQEECRKPEQFSFLSESRDITYLITAVVSICNALDSNAPAATNIQLLQRTINAGKGKESAMFAGVILSWAYTVIENDFAKALTASIERKVFDDLIDVAFVRCRQAEIIKFMNDFTVFVFSQRFHNAAYVSSFLAFFERNVYELKHDQAFEDLLCECVQRFSQYLKLYFEKISYPRTLADLILKLQKMHVTFAIRKENMSAIQAARLSLFRFVDVVLANPKLQEPMFMCAPFVSALIRLGYESDVREFALVQLQRAVRCLRAESESLSMIFAFFTDVFVRVKAMPALSSFARKVILTIRTSFHLNEEGIASGLLEPRLFDSIMEFIVGNNTKSEVFLLFDLAGRAKNKMATDHLFEKLLPVLRPFFDNECDAEIIDGLWKAVFWDDLERDKAHEIRNEGPLTLMFTLVKPYREEFLTFLNYLNLCCTSHVTNALRVNQSGFHEPLVACFSEYRTMTEPDEVFSVMLKLWTRIAVHSTTSKDIMSIFQCFSPLKGNFRPFFTADILNALLLVLDTPCVSPSSFYHLAGDGTLLKLPRVCGTDRCSSFTFHVDIELLGTPVNDNVLFTISSLIGVLTFRLRSDEIVYELHFEREKCYGVFKCDFPLNQWTHLGVVYENRKLIIYLNGEKSHEANVIEFECAGTFDGVSVARGIPCNVGTFGFMCSALSPNLMRLFASFPRTGVTSFSSIEASDYPSEFIELFRSDIHKDSVYMYNPVVAVGDAPVNMVNVELSPEMLSGSFKIFRCRMKAKDIIRVVGGVSSFLPLFGQLDMPLLPRDGEAIRYDSNISLLPVLLRVLTAFLKDWRKNQDEFAASNGLMIIAHLLSRAKFEHITLEIVGLLQSLYKEIIVMELAQQMIEHVYLDLRLWIFLPLNVQSALYASVVGLSDDDSLERRGWFFETVSLAKILQLMRVYLWSSLGDSATCLLWKPKLDKVTKNPVGERPSNIECLRKQFWSLANVICEKSMTSHDAVTLYNFCFDVKDPEISIETMAFLIHLLRLRDKQVIYSLREEKATLASFFPLFASDSEMMRAQCVHIFIVIQSLESDVWDNFIAPYTQDEWMTGIVSLINMTNSSVMFADIVFAHMMDLYEVDDEWDAPRKSVSEMDVKNVPLKLVRLTLLPLAILTISDLPDAVCTKYIAAIDHALTNDVQLLLTTPNWSHPLIMFLMNRITTIDGEFETSVMIVLHILTSTYGIMIGIEDRSITELPSLIHLMSARSGRDFSGILHILYVRLFDQYVLSEKGKQLSVDFLHYLVSMAFEYMFFVSDVCAFYTPKVDAQNGDGKWPRIPYQKLYTMKLAGATPQINFVYSTRTSLDGSWVDNDLAEKVIAATIGKPEFWSTKRESGYDALFMMNFIISAGLDHQLHFDQMRQYVPMLIAAISDVGDRRHACDLAVVIMGSVIKACMLTDARHASRGLLSECVSALLPLLSQAKIQWNIDADAVEEQLHSPEHNSLFDVVAQRSNEERKFMKLVNEFQEATVAELAATAKSDERLLNNFRDVNAALVNGVLSARDWWIYLQLLRFATGVRNRCRQGLKMYRKLWRSLSSEDGPWFRPEGEPIQHYWKLDESLLGSYRRSRLTENYNFDDHADATALACGRCAAESRAEMDARLKDLRMSEFTGDQSVVSIEDDIKGDDDEHTTTIDSDIYDDSVILKVDANYVTMKKVYSGSFFLARIHLMFQGSSMHKHRKIEASSITHLYMRRYLLLDTALEIFTTDKRSYFFEFVNEEQREKVITEICKMTLPNCKFLQRRTEDIVGLVEKAERLWTSGRISTFDYLMQINTLAGRTYNDLGQYPVFPWVIADYTSDKLDLNRPETFRDLSIPVGRLSEKRFAMLAKHRTPESSELDYFYASLYSSQAVIVGFLIRMEPFTTLHIELQTGRFDVSERLFKSIPAAWESVNHTIMDYRELIPEFFCAPEFLVNSNNFGLGEGVSDVELPPWASSPRDFVTKNRAALESPLVAAMLPKWIDLMFGINTRGPEALSANNLFCPFFFESIVTDEVRSDKTRLKFAREYVACFGQVAAQVFDRPSESRRCDIPALRGFTRVSTALFDFRAAILWLGATSSKIFAVTKTFAFTECEIATRRSSAVQLSLNAAIANTMIPVMTSLVCSNGEYIITAVPWDTAFTLSDVHGTPLHVKRLHARRLTAIALSRNFYATASLDCALMLWQMAPRRPQIPFAIMSKFKSHITCLEINEVCDLCVSCSQAGDVMTVSLASGSFIRKTTVDGEPTHVSVFDDGTICVATSKPNALIIMDENLTLLSSTDCPSISSLCAIPWITGVNYLLVCPVGRIVLFDVTTMSELWCDPNFAFDVTRVSFCCDSRKAVLGTSCGKIWELHCK